VPPIRQSAARRSYHRRQKQQARERRRGGGLRFLYTVLSPAWPLGGYMPGGSGVRRARGSVKCGARAWQALGLLLIAPPPPLALAPPSRAVTGSRKRLERSTNTDVSVGGGEVDAASNVVYSSIRALSLSISLRRLQQQRIPPVGRLPYPRSVLTPRWPPSSHC
jgi:hypothetical protein